MPTAKPCDTATLGPEGRLTVLAKLLAGAIIVTPLAMMIFPELSNRLGNNAVHGRQNAPAVQTRAADRALVPFAVKRTD
jgi:hypothetical protein